MSTFASFILISLDGFYEGPNGEFDWPVIDKEFDDFAIRQLDGAADPRVRSRHLRTHGRVLAD